MVTATQTNKTPLQYSEIIESMKAFDFEAMEEDQMNVVLDYLLANIEL